VLEIKEFVKWKELMNFVRWSVTEMYGFSKVCHLRVRLNEMGCLMVARP